MNQRHIAYFPYLSMNSDEINLGYLKVWNFEKGKNKYLKDAVLRSKVEKIFSAHVTHHGKVENIGVIEIPGNSYEPLSNEQIKLVQEARATLFLAFLSNNNTRPPNANVGHWMATSENFDVVFQNFILDDDYVTETSGEIVRSMKAGYTLDKIKFLTPSFVLNPSNYSLDDEIFSELAHLRINKPKVYWRIINSTLIFMEGYYNSYHLSNKARVLLFMSAFESIFLIPENQQRKFFKKCIQDISNTNDEKMYVNYWDKRSNPRSREFLSKKGLWAEKFYLLRNSIVHGGVVNSSDLFFEKSQNHIDIAILFFILAIKKQFEKSRRGYICNYEIQWEKYTNDTVYPERTVKIFIYRYSARALFNKLVGRQGKKNQK